MFADQWQKAIRTKPRLLTAQNVSQRSDGHRVRAIANNRDPRPVVELLCQGFAVFGVSFDFPAAFLQKLD